MSAKPSFNFASLVHHGARLVALATQAAKVGPARTVLTGFR